MKPVSVDPSQIVDGQSVVYAENQPQYEALPAWHRPNGEVVTRWRLTWRERLAAFFGGDLYVSLLTFRQPLQAMYLTLSERDMFEPEMEDKPR